MNGIEQKAHTKRTDQLAVDIEMLEALLHETAKRLETQREESARLRGSRAIRAGTSHHVVLPNLPLLNRDRFLDVEGLSTHIGWRGGVTPHDPKLRNGLSERARGNHLAHG